MNKEQANKLAMLKKCRDEYLSKKDDCEAVVFWWKDGKKSGIGNPDMKRNVIQFCADEAQREIDLIEGRRQESYHVAVLFGEDAVQAYEQDGVDGFNEFIDKTGFPDYEIREKDFDSEELMKAYLDGLNEFAGDERAPGNWCIVDNDDLKKMNYE